MRNRVLLFFRVENMDYSEKKNSSSWYNVMINNASGFK
nr:MAG TPA: hypothetical protein [Caudoviricetes sp.]